MRQESKIDELEMLYELDSLKHGFEWKHDWNKALNHQANNHVTKHNQMIDSKEKAWCKPNDHMPLSLK